MHLDVLYVFVSSFPVLAMSLVGFAVIFSSLKQLTRKERNPKRRRRVCFLARNTAVLIAFMPLGIIYRPSLVEIVKAQIHQQEDADEDDNGDPDSPKKHFLRQLRRVRRGEHVETLSLRLK